MHMKASAANQSCKTVAKPCPHGRD